MITMDTIINQDQIIVDRQALLVLVRCLDCDMGTAREIVSAMDKLREPFFADEIATCKARKDFTLNKYA
jgi:hypothetical protein